MAQPLTDSDEMPFGKHKGKPMGAIMTDHPDYFEWLWGKMNNTPEDTEKNTGAPVYEYLRSKVDEQTPF